VIVSPRIAVLALALALTGAGCGSDKQQKADASGRIDSTGEPLPGIVRIVGVEHGDGGKVTYRVENISGKLQEDLAYRIRFRYPSTGKGAIEIRDDWETTAARDLVLLKGDTAKEISAENPRPGSEIKETELNVENTPPVDTVARDNGPPGSGTLFLDRTLECTKMAGEDEVRAGTLWIELENVSSRPASELEARVVFIDVDGQGNSHKQAETKWAPLADLKPGARSKVTFDLANLGRVGAFKFLVKIRQQSL
jgi:hypothetical protein